MQPPIVIVGIGELGSVFAAGFLKAGHPVIPITRGMNLIEAANAVPAPLLVLVAVGEMDLHPVLQSIPPRWHDRLTLLQNELLPRDWKAHALQHPTVIVVWFEKKKGRAVRVGLPSPVFGPKADFIATALETLDIPILRLERPEDVLIALVHKNLHILTMNITGLKVGGTLNELIEKHQELTMAVAKEVLEIQEWLTETELPRQELMEKMFESFSAFSDQTSVGRSAPARLKRALAVAEEARLAVPSLREIHATTLGAS
jgi:ketopantoate reductase